MVPGTDGLAGSEWVCELSGAELLRFVHGEARPPQRSVLLRFDIGLPACHIYSQVVVPALRERGFHAVFFVLTNAIKDECRDNYICWDALKAWEAEGVIEVVSHGVYHPDYKELDLAGQRWDAAESQRLIETQLGHPADFFGFPFDSVPEHPGRLLEPLGYQLGFAGPRLERSVVWRDPDPFSLPAYFVYSGVETYPAITGTGGLTFGEMMFQAIEPAAPRAGAAP